MGVAQAELKRLDEQDAAADETIESSQRVSAGWSGVVIVVWCGDWCEWCGGWGVGVYGAVG